MLGRTYEGQNCSIAKTLELIGERWTVLILREVFLGHRRFDEIASRLGIARNVLTSRLQRLVEEDVLEKVPYQERPPRFEYRFTQKGLDLWPVLISLLQYGDRYYAPGGPPVLIVHKDCGGSPDEHRICDRCGERIGPRNARAVAGPGSRLSAAAPAAASAPR